MAYTTIDDPSAHFQTATWSGSGATQSITNDGNSDLQPDWVWTKPRGIAFNHALMDSSRGVGASGKVLRTNLDNAEFTVNDYVTSLNSDGFSVGAGDAGFNASNDTYVSWQWKANGGTTSSNTDGSITSTVQANTDAGFSIVTYTGNGTNNATVGHGLGVIPNMIIVKNRDLNVSWGIWHTALASGEVLRLNQTAGKATPATAYFQDENNTSSVFALGTNDETNENADNYIAYCFAEKQGYSKFGQYIGNGSTDGPFVYTGFKPAFLMIKRTDTDTNWDMFTGKISTFNAVSDRIRANLSDAEQTGIDRLDFLSNGFKVRNTNTTGNRSGGKFTYMAFAENPFVTSTGVPTTAR